MTAISAKGHFIDGSESISSNAARMDITSPLDGSVLGSIPKGSDATVQQAAAAAATVFKQWSATPIKERVQVLFRFKQLI